MVKGHQERLASMVNEVMVQAGLRFEDLDRIGVTVGPGSFTGLRVGLAFAKGLALALGRPLVGVTSLEALGAGAPAGLSLALIDARREQAYWQAFEDGQPVTPPQASSLTAIVDWTLERGAPGALIGPGAPLLAARFAQAKRLDRSAADPLILATLAARRAPGPVRPLYLRTPDAKLPGGIDPFA
jgi:tRNA threonylcarbamoyladenosine biosynthesis protein TsaB